MEDGWKRIIRDLADRDSDATYKGFISLIVEDEDLGTVAIDTWVSPTTATQFNITPKNFSYATGSVVYTGSKRVLVEVETVQTVTVAGGITAEAEITNGANGAACEDGAMSASGSFGGVIALQTVCRFYIDPDDTVDVFTKQTSVAGGANITIVKGLYHINIIDVA